MKALGTVLVMHLLSCGGESRDTRAPRHSSTTPRHFSASRGVTTLEITDAPGPLIDGNAPPPPPSVHVPNHPFLGATCTGDVAACADAKTLLDESTSTDDFLDRLEGDDYVITPR